MEQAVSRHPPCSPADPMTYKTPALVTAHPVPKLSRITVLLFSALISVVLFTKTALSDTKGAPAGNPTPARIPAPVNPPGMPGNTLVGAEPPANAEEKAPLFLGQGEQRVLRIRELRRYSIGGGSIRAHSLGNQLLVKGITPGHSDLWVWKSNGSTEHRTIRVEKEVGSDIKPSLARALGSLQEVEVLVSGDGVILRGEIVSMAEAARIAALVAGFPADVHNEAQVSQKLMNDAHIRLENWLRATKNSSRLALEESQGYLWVRGSIDRPAERALVEKQLLGIFPLLQTELDSMPDTAPTVHFRVYLLEMKKTKFHTIGLDWPGAQEGAFNVTTSSIQNLISLNVALQALEGEGSVKVLSNPELVVRAPGDAELFAGGEIPVRMESHFFSNVTWKTYGLSLKLKVTHTTATRVRLEIFTEVSRLDPSISEDKIPGIQANRMKTEVDAQYGVPLLLSGLLQQGTRETAKGLPLLRSIPILGMLFGSDDYLNERSELVAILLPSSSPPPAPFARIAELAPKGMLPPPRDWTSPEDEKNLKNSPEYPWNALQ
jgi:pilus assembly protein CpaC